MLYRILVAFVGEIKGNNHENECEYCGIHFINVTYIFVHSTSGHYAKKYENIQKEYNQNA